MCKETEYAIANILEQIITFQIISKKMTDLTK